MIPRMLLVSILLAAALGTCAFAQKSESVKTARTPSPEMEKLAGFFCRRLGYHRDHGTQ